MSRKTFDLRVRRRPRALLGSGLAAAVVALGPWSTAMALAAGGVYPILLADSSCEDANTAEANQSTSCNPDAPSWTQTDSNQIQQIVVADNVNAPGSVASVAQSQDASIVQAP